MKPVKDEPKIPVELRPDQLADIIDAVLAFADDCANDREILQSMPRATGTRSKTCCSASRRCKRSRHGCSTYRRKRSELFCAAHAAHPAALRPELPGPKRHMPRQVLHLDTL